MRRPRHWDSSTRKRILVTGGAGFLGSHLCERLLRDDVLCVDNYFTGRKDNIVHLLDNPHFEVMRHDITFPLYVEVDEIFNLACPASPVHYQFDPVQTTKTSVIGAINMLGLAKRVGAKILQASTSEVYGDPTVHPQTEDYRGNVNPLGPRACYDEGKRCAETLFFDYHRQHKTAHQGGADLQHLRPAHAPERWPRGVEFHRPGAAGQDITLYGDGSQTRAFCYVDDLIEGFIRMMATGRTVTGPINIGNPHEIPVRELAERVIGLTGSRRGSCTGRCRRMIRCSAARTSPWPDRCWGGNRKSASTRDFGQGGGVFPPVADQLRAARR